MLLAAFWNAQGAIFLEFLDHRETVNENQYCTRLRYPEGSHPQITSGLADRESDCSAQQYPLS
jgi:hypothetical protein